MAKSFSTATGAFHHMLDLHEAQPDRRASILAAPDYVAMRADEENAFHEAAFGAQAAGAIRVEMRRQPDEHLIKVLRLDDAAILYRWVSRTPSDQRARAAWQDASR